MVHVEGRLSPEQLSEWKNTILHWENTKPFNVESLQEWIVQLEDVFRVELNGLRLDQECIVFWRKQLRGELDNFKKEYEQELLNATDSEQSADEQEAGTQTATGTSFSNARSFLYSVAAVALLRFSIGMYDNTFGAIAYVLVAILAVGIAISLESKERTSKNMKP